MLIGIHGQDNGLATGDDFLGLYPGLEPLNVKLGEAAGVNFLPLNRENFLWWSTGRPTAGVLVGEMAIGNFPRRKMKSSDNRSTAVPLSRRRFPCVDLTQHTATDSEGPPLGPASPPMWTTWTYGAGTQRDP